MGFNQYHAFRYAAGTLVDIHPRRYTSSMANAISDEGVIVGSVELSNGDTHAARWGADNSFTDLGSLGGNYAEAFAVNNAGTIVGRGNSSGTLLPFVWRGQTGLTPLGQQGSATGISDLGRIVGFSFFNPFPLAATTKGSGPAGALPLLPGFTWTEATAVNRCGTIVGLAISNTETRAVRWNIGKCD